MLTPPPCVCRQTDSIVNRWLAVRYLVIGLYVGVATVAGSVWWHLYYQVGSMLRCLSHHVLVQDLSDTVTQLQIV